jgi:HEAT repeat protein
VTEPSSPHLPDSEVAHRRRAAAVAGHRGDADTARSFLHDADDTVRATALAALLRAHHLTTDDLTAALADPSATVRSRAVELVAELGGTGPAAPVPLVPLLEDSDPTVVEVAAWALGEREVAEPGSVAALAELATTADDALVRESAVAALGSLGDPAGLPAILAATTDKATVRRRAVIALAPFDGDEVEAALHRALTDRDWQVRQAAEDLTTDAPQPAEPAEPAP